MPQHQQRPRFAAGKEVLIKMRTGGWKPEHRELVREALDADCSVRMARSGHVIIANRYGGTTTVASGGNGRGSKALRNYSADVRRVIREQNEPHPIPQSESRALPTQSHSNGVTPVDVGVTPDEIDVEVVPNFVLCQTCKPPTMHPDEKAMEAHRTEMHFQCPDCGDWIRSKGGYGGHKAIKHGTSKPWESRESFKGARKPTVVVPPPVVRPEPTPPTPGELDQLRLSGTKKKTTQPELQPRPVARPPATAHDKKKQIRRVQDHELPDEKFIGRELSNAAKLARIQFILGEDPRIKELVQEVEDLTRRCEDAETKLQMLKDHLRGAQEVVDL